jgi:hypothetical protein
VLPNRERDDFVTNLATVGYAQDTLPAQINRTAVIMAWKMHFGRAQILSDEVAFAKYRQKEWPNQRMDQVVANMAKRELNWVHASKPKYICTNERNYKQNAPCFLRRAGRHDTTYP